MTALLAIMAGFTAGPSFLAIALAAGAAFCFATAAALQHRAITTSDPGAAAHAGLGARIRTRGLLAKERASRPAPSLGHRRLTPAL